MNDRFLRLLLVVSAVMGLVLLGPGTRLAVAQSATGSVTLGPIEVLGDEPSYADLGLGVFNLQDHRDSSASPEINAEFRYGKKLFFIGPMFGILASGEGAIYGYGGVYSDITLGKYKRLVFTPAAAVGGYHRGGSIDLGETFEFRLEATVAYEFNDRSRFGVKFAHLSNAGISSQNPGENELLLTYAVPLHFPF